MVLRDEGGGLGAAVLRWTTQTASDGGRRDGGLIAQETDPTPTVRHQEGQTRMSLVAATLAVLLLLASSHRALAPLPGHRPLWPPPPPPSEALTILHVADRKRLFERRRGARRASPNR